MKLIILLIPLLVFILINFTSYSAYQNTLSTQQGYAQREFVLSSEKQFNAFKQVMDSSIAVAQAMQAFYYGSNYVSREEFKNFSTVILKGHPEIHAINWLLRIAHQNRAAYEKSMQDKGFENFTILDIIAAKKTQIAEEKAVYFPLHYVEPFEQNKKAFSLNSLSNPLAKIAINKIQNRHRLSISSALTLFQEEQNQKGVLIFHPVIKANELLGLIELVLRLDTVLNMIQQRFDLNKQIIVYLTEMDQGKQTALTSNGIPTEDKHSLFFHQRNWVIADKQWQLSFYPSSELISAYEFDKKEIFYSYLQRGPIIGLILSGLLFFVLSQKQKAERNTRKFKQSESRFKKIIDQTSEAYFLYDAYGNYIDVNKKSCERLGYTREEFLQLSTTDITSKSKQELTRFLCEIKVGETKTNECQHQHKDKHWINVEESINHFMLNDQPVFSALARDITERIKTTQALKDARDEALQSDQAKSEFLANMSHELRTPMHGILSFARFGIKNIDKQDKARNLKYFLRILSSGERLLSLLNDLLDLSKLESGHMKLDLHKHMLTQTLNSCLAEQETIIQEQELQIKKNVIEDDFAIFDAVRIGQVITNLLSNAIKFTPKEKAISIVITKDILNNSSVLCFSIDNEGVGIPKGELEQIFDKFIQSSNTKTSAGGTGLGLPICKEILSLHRGEIWAEHAEHGGSVFKFVIPLEEQRGMNYL
ncbi:MAG: CHASE domain-containing protein [Methylococcales bacterium]|nr:CHASE domain-containing protein [Methylococcales bacterium]